MALITASAIGSSVASRFPALGSGPGVVDQLAASGESLESIQAAGLVSYTQPTGKRVYVRAVQQHLVAGHPVSVDDIVQVTEADSKTLLLLERAVLATDDEVAAAQKGSKK